MLQAGFEPGSPGGAPPEDPGSDRSANCATATALCSYLCTYKAYKSSVMPPASSTCLRKRDHILNRIAEELKSPRRSHGADASGKQVNTHKLARQRNAIQARSATNNHCL